MIGVAQDDLGPGSPDLAGTESSYHRVGSYRHEGSRPHLAMGQGEPAGASRSVGLLQVELKHQIDPRLARALDRSQNAVDLPAMHQVMGGHEPNDVAHAFGASLAVKS